MLLKIGSVLLVLWGSLNVVGGAFGSVDHPSPLILPLFIASGFLIIIGGIGYWRGSAWAAVITPAALIGLSLTALESARVLHGWDGLNMSHHVLRLLISGILFVVADLGRRRTQPPHGM
jgi:hypothetical protein